MPIHPIVGAATLKPPPPLRRIRWLALDDEKPHAGGGSDVGKMAKVRSAGERRVDDDAEAEAELRRGETVNDVVGEIVDEGGG